MTLPLKSLKFFPIFSHRPELVTSIVRHVAEAPNRGPAITDFYEKENANVTGDFMSFCACYTAL